MGSEKGGEGGREREKKRETERRTHVRPPEISARTLPLQHRARPARTGLSSATPLSDKHRLTNPTPQRMSWLESCEGDFERERSRPPGDLSSPAPASLASSASSSAAGDWDRPPSDLGSFSRGLRDLDREPGSALDASFPPRGLRDELRPAPASPFTDRLRLRPSVFVFVLRLLLRLR